MQHIVHVKASFSGTGILAALRGEIICSAFTPDEHNEIKYVTFEVALT